MRKPLFQLVVLVVCLPGLASAEPPPLEDLAITGAVERRLRIDEAVPEARIDVSTHEGIVTLSGFVAVAPVDIPIWLDRLTDCRVPVLAVWGAQDDRVPHEYADALVENRAIKRVRHYDAQVRHLVARSSARSSRFQSRGRHAWDQRESIAFRSVPSCVRRSSRFVLRRRFLGVAFPSLGTWFADIGNPCLNVGSFWTHPSERIMKWRSISRLFKAPGTRSRESCVSAGDRSPRTSSKRLMATPISWSG